jgi:YggT family protein
MPEAAVLGTGAEAVKRTGFSGFSDRVPAATRLAMLNPIAALLIEVLEIYKWIVIAAVIVSWLVAFNVINVHNNFVRSLLRILTTLTEPVFRQIRRFIPPVGGLDLSPIVVFVIIWFLQYTIQWASFRFGL